MSEQNNNREIAIKLSGVKKQYKLGQIGGGTLTADIQSWWARKRGKEDPNSKIGSDQRLIGKKFMALNGIDLTVYKGEALGIIGGNGAGKSTMLKLLSRVTAPTEGEIDIYGRITSMLEVGTGFNGELTGRENVYMNGAILGMTKAEIDSKMEDIIEFSEVREFIDTPVKRYSSGMYVKLAFSVAAHLDSEIMIMDEVLAVGDMAFQKKCLDKMRDAAKREGRTVLYVSHNMNTIRQLCDRCIVLDQGKVVFEGDVESGIAKYLGRDDSNKNEIVFSERIRNSLFKSSPIKFSKITFGDEYAEISYGDSIEFEVELSNNSNLNHNVHIRAIIHNLQGVPILMSSTKSPILMMGNSSINHAFVIDTHNLVQGSYYIDFVVFEFSEQGIVKKHDGTDNLFNFSVRHSKNLYYGQQWESEYWGSICNGYLINKQ